MTSMAKYLQIAVFAVALFVSPIAMSDVVTDWNIKVGDIVTTSRLATPPSNRVLAIVHTAMYAAANAVTKRYPTSGLNVEAVPGTSLEAAIAAANHAAQMKLLPAEQGAIESAYQGALAKVEDGAAKSAGIAAGEQAAAAVFASRADDIVGTIDSYRPYTTAGVYVPTVVPIAVQWPQRKPWLMTSAAQFRPGPPPALTSEVWTRDYNEIKALGGKNSMQRTAAQTEIARFWEATLAPIYYGLVRSVADIPGRDVTQNARLFAAVTQAMDDAMIAVFDAKYQYNFWRPITAIRNGDIDGNDATERDPSWTPFVETPMHPEYPCAHCIIAGAVGAVLEAEIGAGPSPILTTTSSTAKNTARSWKKVDDFVQEVALARICDGVHYRNSTEVGTAMGKEVGALAVAKFGLRAD